MQAGRLQRDIMISLSPPKNKSPSKDRGNGQVRVRGDLLKKNPSILCLVHPAILT